MKLCRPVVLGVVLAAALPTLALAQAKAKKPGVAECTMLLDPFRNKQNAAVKDEEVKEYAPLVTNYWKKGCPAKIYQDEIKDPDLRQRIEVVAPRPKAKTAAKKG
jgi:hypothetical protein